MKNEFYIIAVVILAFCFSFQIAESQTFSSAELDARLKKYVAMRPWEEIFVHIDRHEFIAGEDIWMSIYNIDRVTGTITSRNVIAYIELLSPSNNPIIQMKLQLKDGRGSGNMSLPDTLSPGTYTIRAYTNYMKNFMPYNCFMQDINIYNPFKNIGFKRKITLEEKPTMPVEIKFFPEGGILLDGINCRVVARVTDIYGRGVLFHGIVKDDKGEEAAAFETDEYGYGSFMIKPDKNKNYIVETPKHNFPLPAAAIEGTLVMISNKRESFIECIILSTGRYAVPELGKYHIAVQSHGKLCYYADINSAGSATKITIPVSSCAKGINQLTVFDKDYNPLTERLFYNPDNKTIIINVVSKEEYGKREKVNLGIEFSGIEELNADISISVFPETTIMPQEIKGYLIFGTEFGITPWQSCQNYYSLPDEKVIDYFLVSTRSKWINWNEVLSEKLQTLKYLPETEGHYLSGTVRKREGGLNDTTLLLYLSIPGKKPGFVYARPDLNGRFNFILPADEYLRKLVIQPDRDYKDLVLEIEPPFLWKVPESVSYVDELTPNEIKVASALSFNYQIGRIYGSIPLRKTLENPTKEAPARRFYGIPEIEINLDDYIKLPVMQEVFFEFVPGVQFRSKKQGYEFRILNPYTGLFYDTPPFVMVDGVLVNDMSEVANLDPELVERIEVVKTPYLIGDLLITGIINIVTRKGNFSDITPPDFAVILSYKALEKRPSFNYVEHYDTLKKTDRTPDLRNTVYWNPSFITELNEKNFIEFWTSDLPGNYIIYIQGVAKNGQLISTRKPFKVK
ncbi:MAG TPA: hypothetical protein DFI01_07155 [Bacteroidales bacterium]|nr:hypothetical protein [Bacteroidales bacterium]